MRKLMVRIFVKIGCRCPRDMGNPLGSWSRPSFHALLGHDDDGEVFRLTNFIFFTFLYRENWDQNFHNAYRQAGMGDKKDDDHQKYFKSVILIFISSFNLKIFPNSLSNRNFNNDFWENGFLWSYWTDVKSRNFKKAFDLIEEFKVAKHFWRILEPLKNLIGWGHLVDIDDTSLVPAFSSSHL